jgi:hypothetical protein
MVSHSHICWWETHALISQELPLMLLYILTFYFINRSMNGRKWTFWPHGFHRISIPPPDPLFSSLSILTTSEPSGGLSHSLLGLLYPFSMPILEGEGQGMQVSDNLSSSPYRCIDTQLFTPSSPNFIPNYYILLPSIYTHPSVCRICTSSVQGAFYFMQHHYHSCI